MGFLRVAKREKLEAALTERHPLAVREVTSK